MPEAESISCQVCMTMLSRLDESMKRMKPRHGRNNLPHSAAPLPLPSSRFSGPANRANLGSDIIIRNRNVVTTPSSKHACAFLACPYNGKPQGETLTIRPSSALLHPFTLIQSPRYQLTRASSPFDGPRQTPLFAMASKTMLGLAYWLWPLISALVWLGTLLGLFLTWVNEGKPIYSSMEPGQTIP